MKPLRRLIALIHADAHSTVIVDFRGRLLHFLVRG